MAKIRFKTLKNKAQKDIDLAKDLKELDEIFRKYLGKKGLVTQILHSLEKISKAKRVNMGRQANELKKFLEKTFEKKAKDIKERIEKEIEKKEWVDITIPGKKPVLGHLHPLTQVKKEVEEVFQSMGFSVVEGPEIENEWYNFDALNIPKDHPARDLWDTFWLKENLKLKTKNLKLLVVMANGFAKQTLLTQYKVQNRAGQGIKTAKITAKTGPIIASQIIDEAEEILAISAKGQILKTKINTIRLAGRATQGVKIMNLGPGDKLVGIITI